MELVYLRILESSLVVTLYFVAKFVTTKLVNRTMRKKLLHQTRGLMVKRAVNLLSFILCFCIILLIWGVRQSELAVFIGSILTVIGVAMFAQWSLLSNVTSSVIIFFNHSVKLNDDIQILEGKDYIIEGEVINIDLFFVTLSTQNKETISIPNNIFMQKSIRKKAMNSSEIKPDAED